MKLCECGCGQPTTIAKGTNRKLGRIQGQPMRFLSGHNSRGRPATQKQREAARKARSGERNNLWRGDAVGYASAHTWLNTHFAHEKVACAECGSSANLDWAYTGVNGAWSRRREDYRVLCRSCHVSQDRADALSDRQRMLLRELMVEPRKVAYLALIHGLTRKSVRMSLLYLSKRGLTERRGNQWAADSRWAITTQGRTVFARALRKEADFGELVA